MKRTDHFQKTISIAEGLNRGSVTFPHFPGKIVGFSTSTVGTLPANAQADIEIRDGASAILNPLELSFSEISKNTSSIDGKIVPLSRPNPSDINVIISTSAVIGSGNTLTTKIIIFYEVEDNSQIC